MNIIENPRVEILFPPNKTAPWYVDVVSQEPLEPYREGDSDICLELREAGQNADAVAPKSRDRLNRLIERQIYVPDDAAHKIQYPRDLYYSMLVNTDRMLPYLMALAKVARPGKTVFEIGSGLSVFAMAAARLGARVMALEPGVSGDIAERTARDNGLEIEFVRSLIDQHEPTEKADIVISEFIGDGIFDEGFLKLSREIKNRYLKPGGQMIPYRLEAYIVGVEDDELRNIIARQRSELEEVGRSIGLDLTSYCQAMPYNHQTHIIRSDYRDKIWSRREKSTTVTDEGLMAAVRLGEDATMPTSGVIDLEIENEGYVDGFFVFFRAQLDDQIALTNALNARPMFSWPEIWIPAVENRKLYRVGERLTVDWAYRVFGVHRYALQAGGLPKIVLRARP